MGTIWEAEACSQVTWPSVGFLAQTPLLPPPPDSTHRQGAPHLRGGLSLVPLNPSAGGWQLGSSEFSGAQGPLLGLGGSFLLDHQIPLTHTYHPPQMRNLH